MKKSIRVFTAALVLCLSTVLTPAVSAATAKVAATPAGRTAIVRQVSTGKKTEEMVWIPTNGGKKYHSRSNCSNMKNPEKVTLSSAKQQGFTACKRCH